MNVNDVRDVMEVTDDRLKMIFNRQKELMEKYHDIEAKFRLTSDCPVNMHDGKGQLLLKDFAWRTTEELAEAMDALGQKEDIIKIQEEVADALHFLVEMGILSGIDYTEVVPPTLLTKDEDSLDILFNMASIPLLKTYAFNQVITNLGMTCHTLKNKPWKQTQMLTDTNEYKKRYVQTFCSFIVFCISMDMDSDRLFELYFKKATVNSFRQRSKY